MKFWQKISLFSILTFIIIFNLASVLVIERNHSKMLQQEINTMLRENMNIRSTMEVVAPLLKMYNSFEYEKTVFTNIGNEAVARNNDQRMYLSIVDEMDRELYSNVDFTVQHPELQGASEDEIRYMLSDVDRRTILFTSSLVRVNQKLFTIGYMKDVTPIYQERAEQFRFFLQVDIAACLIYIILMFLISKGLTKPIDKMMRTAKVIAQGDFSKRVEIKSKDEISNLAHHFNHMVSVVEDKINELELHNLEKQRFIQNFTHELKTPLTSIIGYANFLRVTKYQEDVFLDGLNVIYNEAKRLESLSMKMMDLILSQADHFEMKRANLKTVIDEMDSALAMKAKDKNIRLVYDCKDCWLWLEKDLMKILIFNLADNAIKASPEQETVTIRTYADRQQGVLSVEDHGIGIAPEHLDNIFEPFYVSDKARTRSYNGAGLGLSICQSIARIHQGTFEVISEEHKGTTVTVKFKVMGESEVDS
ncbi:sensor histidine kinase [Paenibacillus apis]|uniref:histidine kinase n=1 Tax=Paenibacillus apis TaxID=1792174 RepID=A0A920CKU1_9BACL|nr:HAMP domain-containing sensor histidine kinase [Paenibacillus apis]GIO40993.1 two-component sensor histidine kinase [Paenibacillus apis]